MSRKACFPAVLIAARGYPHIAERGQAGYHGVAILSRLPFAETHTPPFCGKDDCRHIAVRPSAGDGLSPIHNLYVPAGGDEPDPDAQREIRPQARIPRRDCEAGSARRRARQGQTASSSATSMSPRSSMMSGRIASSSRWFQPHPPRDRAAGRHHGRPATGTT